MSEGSKYDAWTVGQSYEHYMGRWSRRIAMKFVDWLSPPRQADWLEIGCGTGALTATVLANCAPRFILATDQSAEFVAHASKTLNDPRVQFKTADARQLPVDAAAFDVVASALVLNFVPDKTAALNEMQRILRPEGLLSFYVWDYPGGGMGFIDAFWKAAAKVDPRAADLNESARFPFCTADGLREICGEAGVSDPVIEPLEVETEFEDFQTFWHPFTLGAGPAPGYCMSLREDHRERLKAQLAGDLGAEGAVRLIARAWAVKAKAHNRSSDHAR